MVRPPMQLQCGRSTGDGTTAHPLEGAEDPVPDEPISRAYADAGMPIGTMPRVSSDFPRVRGRRGSTLRSRVRGWRFPARTRTPVRSGMSRPLLTGLSAACRLHEPWPGGEETVGNQLRRFGAQRGAGRHGSSSTAGRVMCRGEGGGGWVGLRSMEVPIGGVLRRTSRKRRSMAFAVRTCLCPTCPRRKRRRMGTPAGLPSPAKSSK